jgi:two-component system sensor histidine kinase UhpB
MVEFEPAETKCRRVQAYFEAVMGATELGLYGIDLHGRCIFINEVAAKVLGRTQDHLLGQPIHELIRCAPHDDPAGPGDRCADTGFRPAYGCPAEGMTLWRNNGTTVPVEYSSYPIVEEGEIAGTVVTFADITARRQSVQKQRNNAEVFRQLTLHSHEIFWVIDPKTGRMLYVSPGYEETWGRSSDHLYLTPDSWIEFIHQDDKDRMACLMTSQMKQGYDAQYRIVRPDGSIRWIYERAFPVENDRGDVHRIAGIAEDITEYKLVNDALQSLLSHSRALSSYMVKAREDERARIGQEIHDDLGGVLTYLKLDLKRLGRQLAKQGEEGVSSTVAEKLEAMVTATDEAIKKVQRVGMELRPVLLEQFGLAAALDWQVKEFERRTGITCSFEENVDTNVTPDHAILLFRIVQEALTNVARHAEATEVTVALKGHGDSLLLSVTDNGKGIPDGALADVTSFGLMGMSERARLAGGVLRFDSAGRRGTRVTVQVPRQSLKDGVHRTLNTAMQDNTGTDMS